MSDGEQSPPPHGAQLVDIRLQRGQTQVFDGLNLSLTQKRIGVIGNNGAGKSSLFRLLCGLELPMPDRYWWMACPCCRRARTGRASLA